MLCYKDMAFCISPNCVNACGRKLTREIEYEAQAWWNSIKGEGGVPVQGAYLCKEVDGNR